MSYWARPLHAPLPGPPLPRLLDQFLLLQQGELWDLFLVPSADPKGSRCHLSTAGPEPEYNPAGVGLRAWPLRGNPGLTGSQRPRRSPRQPRATQAWQFSATSAQQNLRPELQALRPHSGSSLQFLPPLPPPCFSSALPGSSGRIQSSKEGKKLPFTEHSLCARHRAATPKLLLSF